MTTQKRAEALRCLGLALLVFVVWATVYEKWSWAAWQQPIAYVFDGMFSLGLVRAAADFDFVPLFSKEVHRLGAPFVANWNDFPISEDHLHFFTGLVARVVGVVCALNVVFALQTVAAALCFYFVARKLRLRWEASFVAAALFALAPFTFYRSVLHLSLSAFWHVPLVILVAWWLSARRTLELRSRRFRQAAVIAVVLGISNPYFFNYGVQLFALAALGHVFRGQWRRAKPAVALTFIAVFSFAAVNFDSFLDSRRRGPNPGAITRVATDVEVYALRPLELLHPGQRHHVAAVRAAGVRHAASTIALGEFPSMYLGIVGGAAFLALLVSMLGRVLLGRRRGWSRFGLWSVWLIFIAIDGGGMHLFQLLTDLRVFRSNNRVSIFILALALLFLARALSALKTRRALVITSVVLLALGVFDQTPSPRVDANLPHHQTVAVRAKLAEADRLLVEKVEARLGPGSMVYQLPALAFPETGWVAQMSDYDQFRPYVWSKTLRFSYGNVKGRPEAQWQHQVSLMSEGDLVTELEKRGFAAIYVLRDGYADAQQLARLIDAFHQRGFEFIESDAGDSFFVLLRPSTASPLQQ